MKHFKPLFTAVLALATLLAYVPNTHAQAAYARGQRANAILKATTDGTLSHLIAANGTSSAGAITLSADTGTITTESLTTAAGATYTLTVTDPLIKATSHPWVTFSTTSAGTPVLTGVAVVDGTMTIKITNVHASAAFNSTFKINFGKTD